MEKEIRRIPFATLGKSFPHEELKSLECAIITGFPLQGNAGTLVDLTLKDRSAVAGRPHRLTG
jgi:hypothetical protein